MAKQLRTFGAKVTFDDESKGTIESISGKIRFNHDGKIFHLRIEKNEGHFPISMLIGGIKQFIEEAVEDFIAGKDSHEKVYS